MSDKVSTKDGRASDQEPLLSEGQGSESESEVFSKNIQCNINTNTEFLPTSNSSPAQGPKENGVHEDRDRLTSSCRSQKEFVVYRERWYVLTIFSLTALVQSLGWNTWGPIEDTGNDRGQFSSRASPK